MNYALLAISIIEYINAKRSKATIIMTTTIFIFSMLSYLSQIFYYILQPQNEDYKTTLTTISILSIGMIIYHTIIYTITIKKVAEANKEQEISNNELHEYLKDYSTKSVKKQKARKPH